MSILSIILILGSLVGIFTNGFSISYLLLIVFAVIIFLISKIKKDMFENKLLLKALLNIGTLVIFIFVFTIILNLFTQDNNVDKVYAKGYKLNESGEYLASIKYFNDMLLENPEDYEIYKHIAIIQMKNEEYQEAQNNISRILQENRYNIENNFLMANIKIAQNDYSGAISNLNVIIEKDIYNQKAYTLIGKCYDNQGDGIRALTYFKLAYRIDENFDATLNIAKAYGRVSDIETAMEYFEKAETLAKDESMYIKLNATKAGMLENFDGEVD